MALRVTLLGSSRARWAAARLARFLAARSVDVEVLTDATAKASGVVCGRAGSADIGDASVVVAARLHRATALTADRADLERLDLDIVVVDC